MSGSTPTKAVIAAEERGLLEGQRVFRFAADRVTAALAQCGDVEAVALKFIRFDAAGDFAAGSRTARAFRHGTSLVTPRGKSDYRVLSGDPDALTGAP